MRQIMFKGKRKDNGEWVYGYFVSQGKESYIFEQEEVDKGIDLGGYLDCCQMCEVIPETVGQYTHFNDVNGRKIFEGDIVERVLKVDGQPRRMHVVWHRGSWMLWNGPDDDDFLWNWCAPATDHGVQVGGCVVIGNIYDNIELLEEPNE